MRKSLYILIVLLAIVFYGCPYQSPIELSTYEESLKVDKNLEGSWVAFHDDGSKDELLFEKIARSVMQVSHKELDKNDRSKGINKYRIYATNINGQILYNIENKNGKYMFAKYAWTGKNVFNTQLISEEYMSENFKVDSVTAENLKSFLFEKANLNERQRSGIIDFISKFYEVIEDEKQATRVFTNCIDY